MSSLKPLAIKWRLHVVVKGFDQRRDQEITFLSCSGPLATTCLVTKDPVAGSGNWCSGMNVNVNGKTDGDVRVEKDAEIVNGEETGRFTDDYARVLVELDAKKVIKDSIKVEYADKNATIKGTKDVKVAYDWKPEVCEHCNVFGHNMGKCTKRPRSEEEIKAKMEAEKLAKEKTENKEQQWKNQYKYGGYRNGYNRQEYMKKVVQKEGEKIAEGKILNNKQESNNVQKRNEKPSSSTLVNNENRYAALNTIDVEDDSEMRMLKGRSIKQQPTSIDKELWTDDMHMYFKKQWEVDRLKEQEEANGNSEDVYESGNVIAQTMAANVVTGKRRERKEAWKEICVAKNLTSGRPWLMICDFNVTLKTVEHSAVGSIITNDMQYFVDCVNEVEMEDLCSSGVFYTWIKSPLNPQNSILKKLDRAMGKGLPYANRRWGNSFSTVSAFKDFWGVYVALK
ncbi:DUF4283 domain-containing protein [Artemisia annua]|uniref:DUF4283 domain-containing protein n=1 Tax=Artemisia annua TaxID=35608 RepID=A0A2U1KGK2_ARTAN|nr:DUF4283 domain-containing protein [Artemisia annua]